MFWLKVLGDILPTVGSGDLTVLTTLDLSRASIHRGAFYKSIYHYLYYYRLRSIPSTTLRSSIVSGHPMALAVPLTTGSMFTSYLYGRSQFVC